MGSSGAGRRTCGDIKRVLSFQAPDLGNQLNWGRWGEREGEGGEEGEAEGEEMT